MQKDGFIVEVIDGFIRVYFANDGLKDNAMREPVPGTFGTLGSLVHSRTRTF